MVLKISNLSLMDIIDFNNVGTSNNSIERNELLKSASKQDIKFSKDDSEKVLLLVIDLQNDFLENGSLAVPNSHKDVKNLLTWSFNNLEKITDIMVSLDTHHTLQIFHPAWWVDPNDNHPDPFTVITQEDLNNKKWSAVYHPKESYDYVTGLEKAGKKNLVIWPYHVLEGSFGQGLESQFSNFMYFHSIVRQSDPIIINKGQNPLSEMYGIFKAEYDPTNYINTKMLQKLLDYDKVVIAGEAKSHCVLESVKQIVEFFNATNKSKLSNIYLLEDCMSCIPGFEESTEEDFKIFNTQFSLQRVTTTTYKL